LSLGHWLRDLLSPAAARPAGVQRLPSQSDSELASALQSLLPGDRGWIALGEAARLFSDKEPEYAFGAMDEEGNGKLARFAAERRCDIRIMPMEGRVYFSRED
jgi:hypothetical protein